LRPEAFYLFYKEFDFDAYSPTPTHHFVKLLADKGLMSLNVSQNVDGLEFKAGVHPDLVYQSHGSSIHSHCPSCQKDIDHKIMMSYIQKGEILRCKDCQTPCKPKVLLFGEPFPSDFLTKCAEFKNADLILIMGTSLKVVPYEKLISLAKPSAKRVLINRELVGTNVLDFDGGKRDLFLKGECDVIVKEIAKACGWDEELDKLVLKNTKL